jgi:tetratricopeptide (TPR) repeat protein
MATASVFGSPSPYASGRRLRLSQLWQVPAFVVGLLAVVGVGVAIPLRHPPSVLQRERDIVTVRKALDRKGASAESVLPLAEKILAEAVGQPERAGEAHFLLGSVYQRLAEQRPPVPVGTARKNALTHLEQAEALGVAPADEDKLRCRLARAWFDEGLHTRRVIAYLKSSIVHGADDPARAYAMLGRAYMRLPAPDLDAALEATLKVLALPTDDDEILVPARLLCGEIYLQQKKPLEALKLLETIGSRAPDALLSRARYLRGRCSQDLGMWDKAIPLWQEVLRTGQEREVGRGVILYYLGLCHHNLEQPDDRAAVKFWEEALKLGGEAGQAAALCLAEIRLGAGEGGANLRDVAEALEAYRQALNGVSGPDGYRNALVDRDRVCRQIAWGCATLRDGREFERSLELAELYKKVAAPGEAENLEGEAAEAWARDLEGQPAPADKKAVTSRDEMIRSQLHRAGSAFRAAAAQRTDGISLLWRSSACFLHGQHFAEAAAVLEQLTTHKLDDDKAGEAWFSLAEVRMVLSQQAKSDSSQHWQKRALEAYLKAIEYPGPFASRARYQLALAELRAKPLNDDDAVKHLQQAQTLLEQNLDATLAGAAPDAQEKSLFELANLLMQRNKLDEARVQLIKAIERYPANPAIVQAREQLAECFRRLADEESDYLVKTEAKGDAQIRHRRNREAYLEDAVKQYQSLADELSDPARSGHLTPDEQGLVLRSRFAVAACRLAQENMTREALRLYKILAMDYANRLDGLLACEKVWTCVWRLAEQEKDRNELRKAWMEEGRAGLRKAWDILYKLPESAFKDSADGRTREQWDKWIRERAQYFAKPAEQQAPTGGTK